MSNIPLTTGAQAFPLHVFRAFGQEPRVLERRIGGSVMVVVKEPAGGPPIVITAGVSRLPVDEGLPVELAVEIAPGQEGAALIALQLVCNDIAQHRRTPPFETPWRNATPFLADTQISAIVATGSRWGATFDDVRDDEGALLGHVRTLRLLTDAEAAVVQTRRYPALVAAAGSEDALLDVTRTPTVQAPQA